MVLPVSPHHPLFAGGIESVIGTKEIDTGLRDVQTFVATLKGNLPTAQSVAWEFSNAPGPTKKVILVVASGTVLGVAATGSITTDAVSGMADGDTFTIDDGQGNVKVFEFDNNGSIVSGHVKIDISTITTANQVRDAIIAAINALPTSFKITASNGGAATVTLTNDVVGTLGNTTSSKSSASIVFAITNMTGGVNEGEGGDSASVSWLALGL